MLCHYCSETIIYMTARERKFCSTQKQVNRITPFKVRNFLSGRYKSASVKVLVYFRVDHRWLQVTRGGDLRLRAECYIEFLLAVYHRQNTFTPSIMKFVVFFLNDSVRVRFSSSFLRKLEACLSMIFMEKMAPKFQLIFLMAESPKSTYLWVQHLPF